MSAHVIPQDREPLDPKLANIVYHDWEADSYDEKWSISYDDRCVEYAVGRFAKALGGTPRHFEMVLEVGAGTGFFLLNVAQAGYIGQAFATDISEQMVKTCVANGRRLGIDVIGEACEAESLPFPDNSFDLVMGHAFIHHVPDLETAFSEFHRVLKPGGRLIIAGEPTLLGDAIASHFKRLTRLGIKAAAATLGRERVLATAHHAPEDAEAAALEAHVDLHIFTPVELERLALGCNFTEVETFTEELTANWFGWVTRTAEAMLAEGIVPDGYRLVAYRIWKSLFWLDNAVLTRLLPKDIFYNAILTAVRPLR
ncbi:class I SAM-dependent methyltransferase [Euzebya tangerina]|uniref:class I SAM-dependent methyltransferase n=1 Tax=Euzebya tangerina TaxID=591198 RepID=UPI000E30D37B|nr:class I SAM-dependent methyltransferase [Euzebya tangerina]